MDLSFSTLAGGGVEEKLQYALSEVAANIADPNTDAKKARKITMTIALKPNESRMVANVDINVKTSPSCPGRYQHNPIDRPGRKKAKRLSQRCTAKTQTNKS